MPTPTATLTYSPAPLSTSHPPASSWVSLLHAGSLTASTWANAAASSAQVRMIRLANVVTPEVSRRAVATGVRVVFDTTRTGRGGKSPVGSIAAWSNR